MPTSPEQLARQNMDALLHKAGWVLQDMAEFKRDAAEGVAARSPRPYSRRVIAFLLPAVRHRRARRSQA